MKTFFPTDFQFFPPDYQYSLYYLIIFIIISIVAIKIDKQMKSRDYKHKKVISRTMMVFLLLLAIYFAFLPNYY